MNKSSVYLMFFTNLQILLCWFILCEFFGGHFRELAFFEDTLDLF